MFSLSNIVRLFWLLAPDKNIAISGQTHTLIKACHTVSGFEQWELSCYNCRKYLTSHTAWIIIQKLLGIPPMDKSKRVRQHELPPYLYLLCPHEPSGFFCCVSHMLCGMKVFGVYWIAIPSLEVLCENEIRFKMRNITVGTLRLENKNRECKELHWGWKAGLSIGSTLLCRFKLWCQRGNIGDGTAAEEDLEWGKSIIEWLALPNVGLQRNCCVRMVLNGPTALNVEGETGDIPR